jgi:hypothetical protein
MDEMKKLIVGEFIDDNINASNPIIEWDNDVIILSKFDLGRQIILDNFDIDSESFDSVDYDRLYDLVEEYMNDIVCEVLNGAIEYCDTNGIDYHM